MKLSQTTGWFLLLFFMGCKGSDTPEKNFVSIPSLIEAQVAHVDTSLYSITRYDYRGTDSIAFDTIYVSREQFRKRRKLSWIFLTCRLQPMQNDLRKRRDMMSS